MKILRKQTHYVCGCCKQSLPASAFYLNKRTGLPSNYCKECRKASSRNNRENEKRMLLAGKKVSYPVITLVEDPAERLELIHHALRVVAASIECKRRKAIEAEYAQYNRSANQ